MAGQNHGNTEISKYYDATQNREIRDDLKFSVSRIGEPKIAIDCGCGAGADINYLLKKKFTVYGFDIEEAAIRRCRSRFEGINSVKLSTASFSTFNFPQASLVVADASLFFCPRLEFENVWENIFYCLYPGGIFCGSFLGTTDTMAEPGDNPSVFWPDVTAFDEQDVRTLFDKYRVLRFNTYRSSGNTPSGAPHHWHLFQVVAQKPG